MENKRLKADLATRFKVIEDVIAHLKVAQNKDDLSRAINSWLNNSAEQDVPGMSENLLSALHNELGRLQAEFNKSQ